MRVGDKVKGHTILLELGKGQFGQVFKVQNDTNGLELALKRFQRGKIGRFKLENDILHRLKPHGRIISPKSKIETSNGTFYYLMELADCNLATFIGSHKLNDKEKFDLFTKICEGLEYAHSKDVIHRDLWWKNILIKTGSNLTPKLADFGHAKDFTLTPLSSTPNEMWGARYIQPPENCFRIWKESSLDKYIVGDLFSLGIILLFLFSGSYMLGMLFAEDIDQFLTSKGLSSSSLGSKTISQRNSLYLEWLRIPKKNIPSTGVQVADFAFNQELDTIITRLCNPDYSSRYENSTELLKDVRKL